jgi:predicted house-cleaning noncanonical NTP pyrophosphatase (MazG superfamily)
MIIYDKLIRDKIPEILKNKGIKFQSHVANDDEFIYKLHQKLLEEATEFKNDPNIEEYIDVLEILDTIKKTHNFKNDEIIITKRNKKNNKGGFKDKIILDSTE